MGLAEVMVPTNFESVIDDPDLVRFLVTDVMNGTCDM